MMRRAKWTLAETLLLVGLSLSPSMAEPDARARARVFTRETYNGAHLEFSWDLRESVPFTVENDGDRVILHFENPVALRWGSSLKAVHPYIEQVESRDGGKTVILSMAEPSRGAGETSRGAQPMTGNASGLDLVAAKRPQPLLAGRDEEITAETAEPPPRATAEHSRRRWRKAKKRLVASAKRTPDASERTTLSPGAGIPASSAPANNAPSTGVPSVGVPETVAPTADPSQPVPAVSPVRPAETANVPAAVASASPATAPVIAANRSNFTSGSPVEETESPLAPSSENASSMEASLPTLSPSAGTPSIPVSAQSHPPLAESETAVMLPAKSSDALSVFQARKRLWIVAGETMNLTIENVRREDGKQPPGLERLPDTTARIFSWPIPKDWSASVERRADGLRIVTGPGRPNPVQTLSPELATAANGKQSLLLPAPGAAETISFTDPDTGNGMFVVPLPQPGTGSGEPRSFVKFDLLQSAQGLAVMSKSDGLNVSLHDGKAAITAPGGLALSPRAVRQLADALSEAASGRTSSTLFPYAHWKLPDEKQFIGAQEQLYSEISASPPETANRARLKLLELYSGEGLFPESLGMADDILRSSLRFYRKHKVSALRGAAYFFSYRIAEARRDFAVPELEGDTEATMWRNLCDELLGEKVEPFDFAANYERTISRYPPAFIQKLAIIAADRAIARKDYAAAAGIFETLQHDRYDQPVRKYMDYMRAKILSETHDETQAQHIWEEQAKDLSDGFIRARAEFSLLNLLLKSDKITLPEAARRLEQLRIVWRGDNLELSVLRQLGGLYAHEKQYAKALETMRDVVLYFPQVPEAVDTARRMEAIFVQLYNKSAADEMPPLEALSLFYEFRDLVPLGKEGDQMIRNLADRLVSIDLLDRAALLLDHQVRNRLQGEDRSRVGARLAHIYLLNHQPEQALDILKTTGYGDLPADLQLERQRYTAQALELQSKPDKAIAVIGSDGSPDGLNLRLSIYWDNKDWLNVVSTAEDILGNRNDPSAPLNASESNVLLKLATAYVYEHDTGQLQYLRDYFTPLMKNNPDRASFLFITTESGNVDYDNLAALDQDIGAVKSFLASNPDSRGKNGMSKAAN